MASTSEKAREAGASGSAPSAVHQRSLEQILSDIGSLDDEIATLFRKTQLTDKFARKIVDESFTDIASGVVSYRDIAWKIENEERVKIVRAMTDDVFADKMTAEEIVEKEERRRFQAGVTKFNNNPKKGLIYFEEEGYVEHSPQKYAEFLLKTEGLKKSKIGDYLGSLKDWNLEVLKCFTKMFHFSGQRVDTALREYLATFRMPGEAQKIDRMMQEFANQYCLSNEESPLNPDTAYILSFALIMLNTDLHNPAVKNKMSLDQFFSTLRGVDNGNDFDRDFLEALYASIRDHEIKMEQEESEGGTTFEDPDFSGYLRKQGGRIKTWKKRWFCLTGSCLYYFEKKESTTPKGILPLENLGVRPIANNDKKNKHMFEIYSVKEGGAMKAGKMVSGSMVESRHKTFLLAAPDQDSKEEWMDAISRSIHRDPFYDLLAKRREKLDMEITLQGGGKTGLRAVMQKRRSSTSNHNQNAAAAAVGGSSAAGGSDGARVARSASFKRSNSDPSGSPRRGKISQSAADHPTSPLANVHSAADDDDGDDGDGDGDDEEVGQRDGYSSEGDLSSGDLALEPANELGLGVSSSSAMLGESGGGRGSRSKGKGRAFPDHLDDDIGLDSPYGSLREDASPLSRDFPSQGVEVRFSGSSSDDGSVDGGSVDGGAGGAGGAVDGGDHEDN